MALEYPGPSPTNKDELKNVPDNRKQNLKLNFPIRNSSYLLTAHCHLEKINLSKVDYNQISCRVHIVTPSAMGRDTFH